MSQQGTLNITTAVGRIVQGSIYDAQTKDMDGKQLTIKNGPDAGKPTQRFYFALAIPKSPGATHWANEPSLNPIWNFGHANCPQFATRQDFAWKITDGDSAVPNKAGRRPNSQEGFPGHWVLRLSSSYAVKCFSVIGKAAGQPPDPLTDPGAIQCGYYAQVNIDLGANNDPRNPGVYLNPRMVALAGYGPVIYQGPDPSAVGFGGAALPPGASAAPPAGFTPPAPAPVAAAAPAPVAAPAPAPVAAPAYVAPPAAAVPAVPVQPHPAILTPPALGAVVAPPPPAAVRQMTAKAGGATYEQLIGAGWTDALLVQHGMMTA